MLALDLFQGRGVDFEAMEDLVRRRENLMKKLQAVKTTDGVLRDGLGSAGLEVESETESVLLLLNEG